MDNSFLVILLIVVTVIAIALIVAVVLLFKRLREQEDRLDRFLIGQEGDSLEDAILDRFQRIKILEEKDTVEDRAIRDLYKKHRNAYQKIGVHKYDAFMENGGKLSFALALLDEDNNGIIMNVMNSIDGSYCYIKEIENGNCDIELGSEEIKALEQAINIR